VLEDVLVEPLVFDHQRDVIDVLDVGIREHRIRRNVTEQRDLLLGLGVEAVLAPADDHVWLKADRTDLLDRVLGRLRLLLAVFEYGTSVTWVKRTFSSGFLVGELTKRLEVGHALDVPDGAADFDETDIGAFGGLADPPLDVVGDVGMIWTVFPR